MVGLAIDRQATCDRGHNAVRAVWLALALALLLALCTGTGTGTGTAMVVGVRLPMYGTGHTWCPPVSASTRAITLTRFTHG